MMSGMPKRLIPAIVALTLAGTVVYQMVSQGARECRVCVTWNGLRKCATARAATDAEARTEAQNSACSQISRGPSDSMRCPAAAPDLAECKDR